MKRAFVLGGGGSLGALQVGALRVLLERDIRPDFVVGCSVGALNALGVATEFSSEQLERTAVLWRQVTQQVVYPGSRLNIFWRVATGKDSLHDNRRFYQWLRDSCSSPALTFGALHGARLYVTATHLRTGRLHVFGDDPNDRVLDALMASTALTPLHPPWEINGERYVDGATVTPLPIRVALERGATEIFALQLGDSPNAASSAPVHGVVGHISAAVDTMLRLQAEHDLHLATTTRNTTVHCLHLYAPFRLDGTDFSKGDELIEAGYAQALEQMQMCRGQAMRRL
ncbi:MAG: patatin-like phospholipase family protein [Anaerolineales bacterium]|nr:patatin-like phospholipase family protein [Anaerolineales bacterium]